MIPDLNTPWGHSMSDEPPEEKRSKPPAQPEVVIPAGKLFGDRREVWIEHNGERYRLRITRRGKLILQK